MDISSTLASKNYQNALDVAQPGAKEDTDQNPNFMEKFASDFVETLKSGEETAKAGLSGGADTHSVVEALAATELAVETVITVRDKVVEAYQEILRMPV